MGKSTLGRLFCRFGLPVIDTDEIARRAVEPGEPAFDDVVAAFGPSVRQSDGRLDRAALARIVFSDAERRGTLESILHPRIRAAWQNDLEAIGRQGVRAGVVSIPLLHETDASSCFDYVICVSCTPETQYERLKERGWSKGEIEARLKAQWASTKKVEASDYLVWTDVSLGMVESQLHLVLESIWKRAAQGVCF